MKKEKTNAPRSRWENVQGLFYLTHAEPRANEELAAAVARAEYRGFPAGFCGLSPCAYFKMPYTPPYGNFSLRPLQDRIKAETGLNAIFQGIVALDISEWLGHEQEEYFTVLLAFLADHKLYWRYLFLAGEAPRGVLEETRRAMAGFLKTDYFELPLFRSATDVQDYLQHLFTNLNIRADRKALKDLAELHMREPCLRDPVLMENIARDISAGLDPGGTVDRPRLQAYLQDKNSLLYCLLGDKCLLPPEPADSGKEM